MRTQKIDRRTTGSLLFVSLLMFYSNCAKHEFTPVELASSSPVVQALATPDVTRYASADLKMDSKPLDIILVIDNSGSMQDDSRQLATRLAAFVEKLSSSGFDWQMCWTNTDLSSIASAGMPKAWNVSAGSAAAGDHRVISKASQNLDRVFTDTVNALDFGQAAINSGQGGSKVGDERGIAALRQFVDRRAEHPCLRPGAALTSIVISDEDERSVGGRLGLLGSATDPSGYKIEDIDLPSSLLQAVKAANITRYVANSIILKSGDSSCSSIQNANPETPAYSGTFYEALSQATQGGIGSICDSNYATHLEIFYEKIAAAFGQVPLSCNVDPASLRVAVDKPINTYSYSVNSNLLEFSLFNAGSYHIEVSYRCL